MDRTEYRVMLNRSGRYHVELTKQGESSRATCDFATQSAVQDWIDQDSERKGALDRRWQVGLPALALVDASMVARLMPKCPKRPRDPNQLARHIVDLATGEQTEKRPVACACLPSDWNVAASYGHPREMALYR
jgi:hypothetical protein